MATSQNGLPALAESSDQLHRWIVPGCEREFTLRYGAVGFLLIDYLSWFHEEVEPLDMGTYDDWGHAYRAVRDALDLSNHASGSAADGNATLHPLGQRGTFKPWQTRKIRLRLVRYRGCIRWGGNYIGRPDEMHNEINRSLSACERNAKRLMKTERGKAILRANPGQERIIYL